MVTAQWCGDFWIELLLHGVLFAGICFCTWQLTVQLWGMGVGLCAGTEEVEETFRIQEIFP